MLRIHSNEVSTVRFSLPSLSQPRLSPVVFVGASMVSTQVGSTVAKALFSQVSPLGMVTLRVGLAAVLLLALWRPRWRGHGLADYGLLLRFGLALALMNSCFYGAIARIPIGVAVALEFIGPLTVALLHSRRGMDGLWVGLAAVGIGLLSPFANAQLDPVGVGLALAAGAGWGSYIVLAARTGERFTGNGGLAMAMGMGALLLLPVGLGAEGRALFQPTILALGLGVAVLSSAIPYTLELMALKRLPINHFGVLMSLEPAIAALLGLALLGEVLTMRTALAVGLVSAAAAGVSLQPGAD